MREERVVRLKAEPELNLNMKAKLQTALKSNIDPFFFALSCAMLICISFTAKVLADEVSGAVGGAAQNMIMTADGDLLWTAE
jgi:hypothetical protein